MKRITFVKPLVLTNIFNLTQKVFENGDETIYKISVLK